MTQNEVNFLNDALKFYSHKVISEIVELDTFKKMTEENSSKNTQEGDE